MFDEVITLPSETDLLLRLVPINSEGKMNYLHFCKFLDKRFVRSFKFVQDKSNLADAPDADYDALQSHRDKSAVEIELERPLVK